MRVHPVDTDNMFDVCDLTTDADGVGTVMGQLLCCNAESIAESKYYPQMHLHVLYNDDALIDCFM